MGMNNNRATLTLTGCHQMKAASGEGYFTRLLCPNIEETINLSTLVMNAGINANDLKMTIFSYPSMLLTLFICYNI